MPPRRRRPPLRHPLLRPRRRRSPARRRRSLTRRRRHRPPSNHRDDPDRSRARGAPMTERPAFVLLEDGTWYPGVTRRPIGPAFGEVVFTTNLTGYQETFTDP